MRSFSYKLPFLPLILFEGAAGYLLLTKAAAFTRTLIVLFGVVLLILGAHCLYSYFRGKKNGILNPFALLLGPLALMVGLLCTVYTGFVMRLFSMVAALYGVMLLFSFVFKLEDYRTQRMLGFQPSILTLLSAFGSLALGVVIVLNPFSAVNALWKFSGAVLLLEAVLDLFALLLPGRAS